MSDITREGLKKISYILGEAQNSVLSLLGDLNKNPKALITLESLLCKMRGSTFFYNEDYSAFRYPADADPSVIETYDLVKFASDDNINFGMQGAFLTKNYNANAFSFATGSNWNPSLYGPPCPEGFGTWYYNAWNGYVKNPPSGGFEAGNYETRYESEFPVRYNGTPTPYTRVAFFEHARWISIYNDDVTARHYDDYVYVFEIDKNYLDGIQLVDPETDAPLDVRFMYYNKLLQKHTGSVWQQIDVSVSSNYELSYLAHEIEDNGDTYLIRINIPNDLVYDPAVGVGGTDHYPETWWHIVMFWGSKDGKVLNDVVAFDDAPSELVLATNEIIIWDVKHFFNTKLNSKLTWTDHAINDSSDYNLLGGSDLRYLIANNRLHFELIDGNANVLPESNPYKYNILDSILTQTQNFSTNSISNYVNDLQVGEYQSAILMVKTYGATSSFSYLDTVKFKGFTDFAIKTGPKFSANEARSDWENFEFYPEPDDDYLTFAKIILKRASTKNYGSIEANFVNGTANAFPDPKSSGKITILQNTEIAWIEQVPMSFAIKPHGDTLISSILVPSLFKTVNNFRFERKDQSILNLAARLLILASRTPSTIANSATALIDPNGAASNIFRRLLKSPVDPLLQPEIDETLAIQFNSNERRLIESISSKPPSTEMLRLNADNLFLVDNKLNLANSFEVFLEPTDQCTAADNQASGNRLGLDYTLRLILEDSDENTLQKDWYILASKYFVSKEEYQNRIQKEQSVIGYFTYDNLDTIDDWRLQGYAAVVPDLSMGESRVLTTRFVNPPDGNKETLEQFRARYEALGRTSAEIDELVLKFLEAGGEFYTEDLFQYGNQFTSIREASINITTMTEGTPYWQSNIKAFNSVVEADPETPDAYYSDSFTITLEGASGQTLDSFGKQAETIYEFVPSSSIVDLTLHNNNVAFNFSSGNGGRITTVALKLKADLFAAEDLFISNSGLITVSLYSSNTANTAPDSLLKASSNSILYTDLENDIYQELYWNLDATLLASTDYWIVINLNSAPQGGDIKLATQVPYDESARKIEFEAFSFVNVSDTNAFECSLPLSVILSDTNTTNALTNSTGSIDIKIYSSNADGTINESLSFTSANDSIDYADLTGDQKFFAFNATITLESNTKYWIALVPSERQRGGSVSLNFDSIYLDDTLYTKIVSDNGSYSIWDNWDGVNYKAWLKVNKVIPEVYGYFRRDEDDLESYLPKANTQRITTALLQKEASWAWTIKKFPEPSIVYIYPRYIAKFIIKTGLLSVSSGSTSVTGSGTLFTSELESGSKIYNSAGSLIGTVASIASNTSLTLTSNSGINISSENYNSDGYVPFFRDIYVVIRLMVGGEPKDYYKHLDPTTTPIEPIAVNDISELAESVVYVYVAKTLEELQNGYHGAPAGDRLVIRSS